MFVFATMGEKDSKSSYFCQLFSAYIGIHLNTNGLILPWYFFQRQGKTTMIVFSWLKRMQIEFLKVALGLYLWLNLGKIRALFVEL